MGVQPGGVFVHRNIANMVISIDLNVMSVLNYALDNLKIDFKAALKEIKEIYDQ